MTRKCNNVRHPYELSDFWTLNSPDLNNSLLQNLGQRIYQIKVQDVNDLRQHLNDVKLQWNRALLTMALTTGAVVFMPTFEPQEDIFNIHRDIN